MDDREVYSHSILLRFSPHDLMLRVGAKGRYQTNVFYIVVAIWLVVGVIVFQTPFLFLNPTFLHPGTNQIYTKEEICTVDKSLRKSLYSQDTIISINGQFGPFVCDETYIIGVMKSLVYLGSLIGYLAFSHYTDNYGRKFGLYLTGGSICIGSLMVVYATNAFWVSIGLLFVGMGRSITRITVMIINEVFDDSTRQKCSVILEAFQGFSGFMIVIGYYFMRDWKPFYWTFILIPSFVIMLLIIFYIEETPTFLLMKKQQIALKALNRIGRINTGKDNLVTQSDIRYFYSLSNVKKRKKQVTFKHLLTLPSLKYKTYFYSLLFFSISQLYYGPIFIVDQLQSDLFGSMIVFSIVEFVGGLAVLIVEKTPRRTIGMAVFSISTILTGILIFIKVPQDCGENCFQSIITLICLFGSRTAITFYFTIMFLYGNQLFPVKARGLGLGLGSAAGAISTSSCNIIITFFYEHDLNIMYLFTFLGLTLIYSAIKLPQTLNQPMEDDIQQFKYSRLVSESQKSKQMKKMDRMDQMDVIIQKDVEVDPDQKK